MKQQTWIAVILVGAVAVNGVAYMVVRSSRAPAPTPAAVVAEAPRVASAPRAPPVEKPPEPEAPAEPAAEEDNPGLARAHRAAGLAALEDRDYDKAVSEFAEALRLRKDKGDLVDLLRIAEDLRSRGQTKTVRAEPTRTPSRTPAAKPSRPGRAGSRTAARGEESTAGEPETAARGGLLLVTSTPPGLVVQVDGKAKDLTPARMTLAPGTYRVALLHGERLLVEERVEVKEDSVQSLNRDVSAELNPAPVATRATPEPEPVPAARTAVAPSTPTPAPASAAGTEAAPRVASAAASARGDLDITSPALYGEVWINNRPYGFPPVSARGLPSGPARVEVRVNGEVKRRMTVEVQPGRSTPVRVR